MPPVPPPGYAPGRLSRENILLTVPSQRNEITIGDCLICGIRIIVPKKLQESVLSRSSIKTTKA